LGQGAQGTRRRSSHAGLDNYGNTLEDLFGGTLTPLREQSGSPQGTVTLEHQMNVLTAARAIGSLKKFDDLCSFYKMTSKLKLVEMCD
jgi:hypothetical protein